MTTAASGGVPPPPSGRDAGLEAQHRRLSRYTRSTSDRFRVRALRPGIELVREDADHVNDRGAHGNRLRTS